MTDLPGVSVADPGFSPGGANSQSGYANLFFLVKKLHENERILAPRGAGVPGAPPPLRFDTGCARFAENLQNWMACQVVGRMCWTDFLAFTLKLPIQTILFVAPTRSVF